MKNFFRWMRQISDAETRITYSTALTIGRILMIPFIVGTILSGRYNFALVLLAGAALSDVADGYIARKFNEQTLLGALLDPLADKLLTVSCFFALIYVARMPVWFGVIAFIKEIVQIIGAGAVLHESQTAFNVHVTLLGKATMVGNTVLITWMLLVASSPCVDYWALCCMTAMMVASLCYYAYVGFRRIM